MALSPEQSIATMVFVGAGVMIAGLLMITCILMVPGICNWLFYVATGKEYKDVLDMFVSEHKILKEDVKNDQNDL